MWTPESLNNLVGDKVPGYLFVMVSNREPYVDTFSRQKMMFKIPASGVTLTLGQQITTLIWRGILSLSGGVSC
jgi:hypothetical protein